MQIYLDDKDKEKLTNEQIVFVEQFNNKYKDLTQRVKNIRSGDKSLMKEELKSCIEDMESIKSFMSVPRNFNMTLRQFKLFNKML